MIFYRLRSLLFNIILKPYAVLAAHLLWLRDLRFNIILKLSGVILRWVYGVNFAVLFSNPPILRFQIQFEIILKKDFKKSSITKQGNATLLIYANNDICSKFTSFKSTLSKKLNVIASCSARYFSTCCLQLTKLARKWSGDLWILIYR